MDISNLISRAEIFAEAKRLKRTKGKRKTFTDERRFLAKRDNAFFKYLDNSENLEAIVESLKDYSFQPYTGFSLFKGLDGNGNRKYRPLLIPADPDRLLFSIVNRKLFSILEPHLKKYACLGIGLTEQEQSVQTAKVIGELIELNNQDYVHILKTDFKKYFCTIERKRLLKKFKPFLKEEPNADVLYLFIKTSLYNDIYMDDTFKSNFGDWELQFKGIPQGLSYSSLLASFYGTILDQAINSLGTVKAKRYLDDMVILGKDAESINSAYQKVKEVSAKIGLKLHDIGPVEDGKTFTVKSTETSYVFLGVEIKDQEACIPEKAINKFKQTIQAEIVNSKLLAKYSPEKVKEVFDDYVKGWVQSYSPVVSKVYMNELKKNLNEWITWYLSKKKKAKKLEGYKFIIS